MSQFHVSGDALTQYSEGSKSLAGKFGELAKLLEQARVDDQCFGPIGDAVGLSSGYFDSLQECQTMATKAVQYLEHVSEQVADTARTYQEVDKAFHDVFNGLAGSGA
ncbi:hypothetical protein ABZ345_25805 [Lentzea sp. NPDC005914]|uniref:hypothetical protein n=1 Tax=Lentzea sp. NPDC005914 TaxID=3154572 RepID=UPI003405A65B